MILDNYSAHKHSDVDHWLNQHNCFHLHFTPTSSSWLNQIERWFRDLTDETRARHRDVVLHDGAERARRGPGHGHPGHPPPSTRRIAATMLGERPEVLKPTATSPGRARPSSWRAKTSS